MLARILADVQAGEPAGAFSGAFFEAQASLEGTLPLSPECMFTWHWLYDLCSREGITFIILGHALYVKAIHGGKAKSDKNPFAQYNLPEPEQNVYRKSQREGIAELRFPSIEDLPHIAGLSNPRVNPPGSEQAQLCRAETEKSHGKGKSLTALAHKLPRAVFFITAPTVTHRLPGP